jgi:hypothetical protein
MSRPPVPTTRDLSAGGRCANCGAAMSGEYCSSCGQRLAERLSLPRALGEVGERLLEFDFAFARTFAGLCRRPATVVNEYIAGRRREYSNPFRYAFVITTLSVIAINLLDIDVTAPGVPIETERDRAAIALVTSLMAYLFFPAIMLLAALQRLAGRRARFNYAEILVFDAYCIGHGSPFAVLVGPVLAPGSPAGLGLILSLQTAYLAWCLRGFRGVGWFAGVVRALLLIVGYILIFNLIAVSIVNGLAIAGLL